jgi:hypothetical protein
MRERLGLDNGSAPTLFRRRPPRRSAGGSRHIEGPARPKR